MTYSFKGPDFVVLEHGSVVTGTNTYDTTTGLTNEIAITPSLGSGNHTNLITDCDVGCGRIVVAGGEGGGNHIGYVWMHDYDGNLIQTLTPSNNQDGTVPDHTVAFGEHVAIGHDRVVVSAFLYGEVYMYNLNGQEIYKYSDSANFNTPLSPPSGYDHATYHFGRGLEIAHGRVIISAPEWRYAGAVYISDMHGNLIDRVYTKGWYEEETDAGFGRLVVAGCGRIVISYYYRTIPASVVICDIDGNYINKITTEGGRNSVAVGNGLIVVGDTDGGNETRPQPSRRGYTSGTGIGKAYVYNLDGKHLYTISNPSNAPADHDRFGYSVAIGCGRILVSAIDDDAGRGAVYVYDLSGNLIQRLQGSGTSDEDEFGESMAINDGKVIITAPCEDYYTSSGDRIGGSIKYFIYDTPDIKFYQDLANGK